MADGEARKTGSSRRPRISQVPSTTTRETPRISQGLQDRRTGGRAAEVAIAGASCTMLGGLPEQVPDLLAQADHGRIASPIVLVARLAQRYGELTDDAGRPHGENEDAVAQVDRLIDTVGDEQRAHARRGG